MKKGIAFLAVVLLLSGCGGVNTSKIAKNMEPPVKGQVFEVFLFPEDAASDDSNPPELGGVLKDVFYQHCHPSGVSPKSVGSVAVIPLISSLGKYLLDKSLDKKTKELEALKKASQNTYSNKVFIESHRLHAASCVLLVRRSGAAKTSVGGEQSEPGLGFVALLHIEHHKMHSAFSFKPIYVSASNATVLTKKATTVDGTEEPASINAAIAVTVKAIVTDKNNNPSLTPIGAGSVSLSNIPLDKDLNNACEPKKCPVSDLIPHLSSNTLVSLAVSVSESGNTGVEFDALSAEIKAIKEAFGPAIKDALKEYFSQD